MDQNEDNGPSKMSVHGEQDGNLPHPETGCEPEVKAEPSCLSVKSNASKDLGITFKNKRDADDRRDRGKKRSRTEPGPHQTLPEYFPSQYKFSQSPARKRFQKNDDAELSCLSLKSNESKGLGITFRDVPASATRGLQKNKEAQPSCLSLKSNESKGLGITFRDIPGSATRGSFGPGNSCVSNESNRSKDMNDFKRMDLQSSLVSAEQHQTQLDSIFTQLEENIVDFVKRELKMMLEVLGSEREKEEMEVLDGEDQERKRISKEAMVKITVDFLKRMKHEELADSLQSKLLPSVHQSNFKSDLKRKFQCIYEGIPSAGNPTLLNQIYTELYITEGENSEINEEHEVRQIETAFRKPDRLETTIRHEDIFRLPPGRDQPIRTVMTKGVAGIGKTVLTQKFSLDWAEDKANQDIQFTFPFTFRELNLLKERKFSLVDFVHHFFSEIKKAKIVSFEDLQVVFIFDGLDECRLPLDFRNNQVLSDVTESSSVDVLLTNLIRGELLPSARLWITTRPAAANQIPPTCVDMMTEIRGFTDQQKEDYFKKRYKDKKQASRIISHIRSSRSLHIMCHIPIFCWITATVLEDVLKNSEGQELPKTLTEMYIYFLVVQTKVKKVKYDGGAETDPHWCEETRKIIEDLAKLAFEQLLKRNLIFYEADLKECGFDVTAASVYSGVFTQIFKEEKGLYQEKVFSFVHLSVQEFLAALHVHLTFIESGVDLMAEKQTNSQESDKESLLYKSAVNKALESPNGHLDLFLRFLLGLSLETNQRLLGGLLKEARASSRTNRDTVHYIKKMISETKSTERSINLFHCLNELNDRSLVEEIQQYLSSGNLTPGRLSSAQWSALIFILLSSEKDLDVFDLQKYSASEEALLRLLPVVKASNKALLIDCNLSERSFGALSSVLSSQSSSLIELDLSNNDLKDSGLELLCKGLGSQHCELQTLRLSGCLITVKGCSSLASTLSSNPLKLRKLDLRYNHPGDQGKKLLMDVLKDQHKLKLDPSGEQWLKPGLRKYSCSLSVDINTVNEDLELSDNNRKVAFIKGQQSCRFEDHQDRFECKPQLLCEEGLTSRCYWEVQWKGRVFISVSYKGIPRKGGSDECMFGWNNQSWSLRCSDADGYSVCHKKAATFISSSSSSDSNKVAVYVDYPAGTLSFYRVESDTLIHLYTFNTTFTEPLYAGVGFLFTPSGSTVSLC